MENRCASVSLARPRQHSPVRWVARSSSSSSGGSAASQGHAAVNGNGNGAIAKNLEHRSTRSASPSQLQLRNMDDDPRNRPGAPKGKAQRRRGGGRNTESFDPKSTLVRPDMRVIVGPRREVYGRPLKHDDVVVVPEFFCDEDDWSIYHQLIEEMREQQAQGVNKSEWVSWHEGAHLITHNPSGSKLFNQIQEKISKYFEIPMKSIGTRFNWYRDSSDWKPFHHDSAAFNPQRARNQNITVGVSFGATRELAFLHAKNGTRAYFPQTNGMLFSFGRDTNITWKHGINALPEAEQNGNGRISIILWGLATNVIEEPNNPEMLTDNTRGLGHSVHGYGAGARDGARGSNGGRDGAGRDGGRMRDGVAALPPRVSQKDWDGDRRRDDAGEGRAGEGRGDREDGGRARSREGGRDAGRERSRQGGRERSREKARDNSRGEGRERDMGREGAGGLDHERDRGGKDGSRGPDVRGLEEVGKADTRDREEDGSRGREDRGRGEEGRGRARADVRIIVREEDGQRDREGDRDRGREELRDGGREDGRNRGGDRGREEGTERGREQDRRRDREGDRDRGREEQRAGDREEGGNRARGREEGRETDRERGRSNVREEDRIKGREDMGRGEGRERGAEGERRGAGEDDRGRGGQEDRRRVSEEDRTMTREEDRGRGRGRGREENGVRSREEGRDREREDDRPKGREEDRGTDRRMEEDMGTGGDGEVRRAREGDTARGREDARGRGREEEGPRGREEDRGRGEGPRGGAEERSRGSGRAPLFSLADPREGSRLQGGGGSGEGEASGRGRKDGRDTGPAGRGGVVDLRQRIEESRGMKRGRSPGGDGEGQRWGGREGDRAERPGRGGQADIRPDERPDRGERRERDVDGRGDRGAGQQGGRAREVCRNFGRGTCTHGDRCKYLHELVSQPAGMLTG